MRHLPATLCLPMALLLFAGASSAQPFKCISGGAVYYSDRACEPGTSSQTAVPGARQIRPNPIEPNSSSTARVPQHRRYLSSECASLNDAIRTAGSRGNGRAVIGDLRAEYDRECREDDQYARQRMYQDQIQDRDQRRSARTAAENEKLAVRRQAEQCDAMREIIQSKQRQRASMSEGDLAALQGLQQSYDQRCLGK